MLFVLVPPFLFFAFFFFQKSMPRMLMKRNKIQTKYILIIVTKGTIRTSDTGEIVVLCVLLKYK